MPLPKKEGASGGGAAKVDGRNQNGMPPLAAWRACEDRGKS